MKQLDPSRVETLRTIMKELRTPETGCPWDIEQDFASIAPYTIEEAYEVADAIERGDEMHLKEELGDLLLQVVYHSQMAAELGWFDFDDVVAAISTKMVRRHPHVFGDEAARSSALAKGFWEDIKARERSSTILDSGRLGGVPLGLPALTRALKLQSRAAKAGFDWPSIGQVLDKIVEEIGEIKAAPPESKAAELGDLLFALVNFARHLDLDAETALRGTNAKFASRFAFIEKQLQLRGKTPEESTLSEMDALWDEAKSKGM